ncbi:unnamed protein product, partial [Heterosigma akashiwo]
SPIHTYKVQNPLLLCSHIQEQQPKEAARPVPRMEAARREHNKINVLLLLLMTNNKTNCCQEKTKGKTACPCSICDHSCSFFFKQEAASQHFERGRCGRKKGGTCLSQQQQETR